MKKVLVLAAMVAVMGANDCSAGLIVSNSIDGVNPGSFNLFTAGQETGANVSAGGIGRVGVSGENAANTYRTGSWNVAALDTGRYVTFTITPTAGYAIDFSLFTYSGSATGSGPTSAAFRSSADGFTSSLGAASVAGATIDLSTLTNVTSAIEFRLYAWGAKNNSSGTMDIDSFSFQGGVSAVPEPSALLLVGSVLGCGIMRRRRG